jgi:PIN domain nuclease of toxin-antitoxin system
VRLLLDTHVWVWSLGPRQKLSRRVVGLVESPRSELWLSAASVWEVQFLARKGRLRLGQPVDSWMADAFERLPVRDAPITREIALESQRIVLATEDPADRFIAATARVYDLTLVTADEPMLALKGISTIPNR